MGRFVLAPEAVDDLELIAAHIAKDNVRAADRLVYAAYELCQLLADNPEIGRLRQFPNQVLSDLRSFVISDFSNYVVFYRPTNAGVEIVRVLHGAQDIDAMFEK